MSATIQIAPMLLLEAQLVHKLEEKKTQGWTIHASWPYMKEAKKCCLLGAQLDRAGDYVARSAAALGISVEDARVLERGFMMGRHHEGDGPFAQLGAKLRAQYAPM